jgi:YHS domain-containing protein/thiol-disulfide isomerase/thioredoxin
MSTRTNLRSFLALLATLCLPALLQAESVGVRWRDNLDAARVEASQNGKLLLLHFWTPTCAPCKVLEQTVLSQPQVGGAIETAYVPVKVNAETQFAIANMYKVTEVPTDVVITPDGQPVATLPRATTPESYVAQLDNLARYFRQTSPAVGPSPSANPAYAGLQTPQPSQASPAMPAQTVTQASAPVPQNNPYTAAAATAAATQASAAAVQAPAGPPMGSAPTYGAAPTYSAAPNTLAQGGVITPANAMPRSYRDTGAAAATSTAPPFTGTAAASTPAGAPAATNSAYANLGATAAVAGAAATTSTVAPPATNPVAGVAAPGQVAQSVAAQPPLPADCPPVAFDGCCPVTLRTKNAWATGSTAFGAIHRGRTYLFVGDAERQQFMVDPDSYSPVFAGYDPVLLLEKQQTVSGQRKFGYKFGNAFYLFSCVETMEKFKSSPHTYAAGVRQAMAKIDAASGATIRR